ncbi:hypothetical protein D3C73_1038950 [compost metagenome]
MRRVSARSNRTSDRSTSVRWSGSASARRRPPSPCSACRADGTPCSASAAVRAGSSAPSCRCCPWTGDTYSPGIRSSPASLRPPLRLRSRACACRPGCSTSRRRARNRSRRIRPRPSDRSETRQRMRSPGHPDTPPSGPSRSCGHRPGRPCPTSASSPSAAGRCWCSWRRPCRCRSGHRSRPHTA